MTRKLALHDIADLRAYERERDEFRARIIDLKKRRRIAIGPHVTILFENRDTVRFQIQEMARVERLLSDEAIETELGIYNPLIPEPGELGLTLFIELTSDEALREWLPLLVGIETHLALRVGTGAQERIIRATPDADHAANLTRDEITSAVHYLHFHLSAEEIDAVASGPVAAMIDLPTYSHATTLRAESVEELLFDLRP